MTREVEKLGHLFGPSIGMARVREASLRITKLVKERMAHGIDGRETLGWGVLEECSDQLYSIVRSLAENL